MEIKKPKEIRVMIYHEKSEDGKLIYTLNIDGIGFFLTEDDTWRLQQRLTAVLARA